MHVTRPCLFGDENLIFQKGLERKGMVAGHWPRDCLALSWGGNA